MNRVKLQKAIRVLEDTRVRMRKVVISRDGAAYTVRPVWTNVDRTDGCVVHMGTLEGARALAQAMASGKWFRSVRKETDYRGHTFAAEAAQAYGSAVEEHLKRMGEI